MRVDEGADGRLWAEVLEADRECLGRRGRFLRGATDAAAVLRRALTTVPQRGAALRFLRAVHDPRLTRAVLPELVDLASVTHIDTVLARRTISDMRYEPWLPLDLPEIVRSVLREDTEERYRRVAELLAEVDVELLERHLEACRQSADPEVRALAAEFDGDGD